MTSPKKVDPIDRGFMWALGTIVAMFVAMLIGVFINDPTVALMVLILFGLPTGIGFAAYLHAVRKNRRHD